MVFISVILIFKVGGFAKILSKTVCVFSVLKAVISSIHIDNCNNLYNS